MDLQFEQPTLQLAVVRFAPCAPNMWQTCGPSSLTPLDTTPPCAGAMHAVCAMHAINQVAEFTKAVRADLAVGEDELPNDELQASDIR